MVGGIGESLISRGINRAKETQGLLPRPPASTFKMVLYLAALEKGLKPKSLIDASPVIIPGTVDHYQPKNVNNQNYGKVSLQRGLVFSINTAAVRLLQEHITYKDVMDLSQRLGIQGKWLRPEWALALGGHGVPMIEMITAYAVIANGESNHAI